MTVSNPLEARQTPYEAGQMLTDGIRPNYFEAGANVGNSALQVPDGLNLLEEVSHRIAEVSGLRAGIVEEDTFVLGVVLATFDHRNLHKLRRGDNR